MFPLLPRLSDTSLLLMSKYPRLRWRIHLHTCLIALVTIYLCLLKPLPFSSKPRISSSVPLSVIFYKLPNFIISHSYHHLWLPFQTPNILKLRCISTCYHFSFSWNLYFPLSLFFYDLSQYHAHSSPLWQDSVARLRSLLPPSRPPCLPPITNDKTMFSIVSTTFNFPNSDAARWYCLFF